ncbi:hypothetical protein Tco_1235023 [Tanacetum coccineum]
MSFSESDDEDYTVIYDNDSFSYKTISVNDLKSDTDNNDGKINVKLSLENISIKPLDSRIEVDIDTYSHTFDGDLKTNHDKPNMALPSRAERHLWLRFDAQEYTDANIHDFEDILARIFDRQIHRVQVLDFDVLMEEMDQAMIDILRMEHTNAHGQVVFTSHAWRQLFRICGPLVKELILEFFSTFLGLHTEEEMDNDGFRAYWVETLRVIASKADLRDYWTRISSSGDFLTSIHSYTQIREPLRRLCHRLISFSIVGRGQTPKKVATTDLFFLRSMDKGMPVNTELGICPGLLRGGSTELGCLEQVFAAARGAHVNPEVAQEGVQADPAPIEAAQMPQTAAPAPRRVGDRLLNTDQSRFATLMIVRMTQLMDASGLRRECEIKIDELKAKFNKMSIEINKITKEKELRQREQAANESTIPLNEITSQIPPSIAITLILPTLELEDSLIIGNEDLITILEKESDEFIKYSVEDLVPILSESEDTSESDSVCDLPFCDNSVTFSNPLFDVNDDFTSSDDESLPEEDVPKENFKIYLNPLFEFDDEYISSDVNPLFNEVLEDIESKDSYVSNL